MAGVLHWVTRDEWAAMQNARRHRIEARRGKPPAWVPLGPDGLAPSFYSNLSRDRYYVDGEEAFGWRGLLAAANGSYSRASDAWGIGPDGKLRKSGSNILRQVYDPVSGKALGALLEGAATNLLVNSKFDGAVSGTPGTPPTGWEYINSGGTTDVIDFGEYKHLRITTSNARHTGRQLSVSVAANKNYFFSVPIEVVSGALGIITLIGAFFLPTGATTSFVLDGAPVANPNTPLSVGKHLIGVLVTTAATAGTAILQFGVGVANTTSGEAIFGTPQFEEGTFRSSPILTDATGSVARLADSLSFARAGTPEGTVVIRGRTAAGVGSLDQVLWQWDGGGASNRYAVYRRASNRQLTYIVVVGGTLQISMALGTLADNTDFAVGLSFKDGRNAASLNGAASVVDTAYTGPLPIVTTTRVGTASDGREWFGTIASLRLLPKAYDPAQLPGMLS